MPPACPYRGHNTTGVRPNATQQKPVHVPVGDGVCEYIYAAAGRAVSDQSRYPSNKHAKEEHTHRQLQIPLLEGHQVAGAERSSRERLEIRLAQASRAHARHCQLARAPGRPLPRQSRRHVVLEASSTSQRVSSEAHAKPGGPDTRRTRCTHSVCPTSHPLRNAHIPLGVCRRFR